MFGISELELDPYQEGWTKTAADKEQPGVVLFVPDGWHFILC